MARLQRRTKMKTFKLKAVRKCDPFRASLAGKSELLVREWILPSHEDNRELAAHKLVAWVVYELGGEENGGNSSLMDCTSEIWSEIYHTGHYEHADMVFTLEVVNA